MRFISAAIFIFVRNHFWWWHDGFLWQRDDAVVVDDNKDGDDKLLHEIVFIQVKKTHLTRMNGTSTSEYWMKQNAVPKTRRQCVRLLVHWQVRCDVGTWRVGATGIGAIVILLLIWNSHKYQFSVRSECKSKNGFECNSVLHSLTVRSGFISWLVGSLSLSPLPLNFTCTRTLIVIADDHYSIFFPSKIPNSMRWYQSFKIENSNIGTMNRMPASHAHMFSGASR